MSRFLNGSEAPAPFSERRPDLFDLEPYEDPEAAREDGADRALDHAPLELEAGRSPLANVGYAKLKGKRF